MILRLQSKTGLGFLNLTGSLTNFESYGMISYSYINFGETVKKLVKQVSKYNDR